MNIGKQQRRWELKKKSILANIRNEENKNNVEQGHAARKLQYNFKIKLLETGKEKLQLQREEQNNTVMEVLDKRKTDISPTYSYMLKQKERYHVIMCGMHSSINSHATMKFATSGI